MKFATILLLLLPHTLNGQTTYYGFQTNLVWPDEQLLLTTLYDGLDTIYLFGVDNHTLAKYSIDSDSMENVATFPDGAAGGGAHFDLEGNIIYVPGYYIGGGPVYKINPFEGSIETVTFTDFDLFTYYMGSNPDTGNIISYTNAFFDIVPRPANISEFNSETSSSELIMQLVYPNKVQVPVHAGSGVYHFPSRYADCSGFPTWPCITSNHVVSVNIKTKSYVQRAVQYDFTANTYPKVWAEDRILILNNTIAVEVRLDQPLVRIINLSGVRPTDASHAVYVPRLDRIYIFGGQGISGVWYFKVSD